MTTADVNAVNIQGTLNLPLITEDYPYKLGSRLLHTVYRQMGWQRTILNLL